MQEMLNQLIQIQNMCLSELEQSQTNAQRYSSNIKQMTKLLKKTWEDNKSCLTEYDSYITNITSMLNTTRKFNIQVHMYNLKLKEMQSLFADMEQNGESKGNITTGNWYPAEEHNLNEEFVYPKINLGECYQTNSIIKGKVTHIKSLTDLTFYIFDVSSKYLGTIIDLSKSLELRQYHSLPLANEVFGYVLDNNIFRAVLSSENFYDVEMNQCYILDTGEILPLRANNEFNLMYRLTDEQKTVPAQAIRCQLSTTNKNPFLGQQEMEDKLKALEFELCHLKIVGIENNYLYVELVDDIKELNIENCFDLKVCENLDLASNSINTERKYLTQEELEMLYEEPISTTNAMKAVMGYDPQDDKRICRFYNQQTGSCFKGANCKLEHTLRQPEGWTKDVLPSASIIDCRQPDIVFSAGSVLNITATYVGEIDRFYAQINGPQHTSPLLWNDEDIPSSKLLKKPPHMFELVLARYIDGFWYRAKIVSHDDDYVMFKVHYVDYGNYQVVHLHNLAAIDINKAQYPFQAVLCRIDAVKENLSLSMQERKTAINILCEMILNKTLDVKVISHYEDLFIEFVDQQEYPLPAKLLEMKFLETNKT